VRRAGGAVAQFEKATTSPSWRHAEAEAVALAKALRRKKPKGGKLSLRAVSAAMAAQGFLNERGQPFNHKSVAVMLAA
jgi:hypothetical protein